MKNLPLRVLSSLLTLALLTGTADAKLVAWYPLDEPPSDTSPSVAENVASNNAVTQALDPDPGITRITRGHPSARPNLGTSYRLIKGGGLDLGTAAAVQPTDKFTMAFWIQPLTFDAFDRFFESQVLNANAQDGLRIDTGAAPGNKVRVLLRDNNAAVNSQFTHPLTLKNDGTWYFVAFRYDSAGVDNAPFQITLVEATGAPVDAAAIATATAGPATITNGPMHYPHARSTLVGLEVPNNLTQANNLHGSLDELAFYDNSDGMGVLTNQQLADVYNFGPSGVQLINTFTTNRTSVSPGNPATLSWNITEPFDSLVLSDGVGGTTDLAPMTTAGAGTFMVNPSMTTTYSLRATRGAAANVSVLRLVSGAAPEINAFTASAPVIQVGGSVDLSWTVNGADTLTLNPGAVDVTGLTTTNLSPGATTTYTLTATNTFGSSTANVTVTVIAGPIPAFRYVASTAGNTATIWFDDIGTRDWAFTGGVYNMPLVTPSPNTSITASYSTIGGINGGSTASFQLADFTAEIWLRPGTLTANHECLFETGGGQNGLSVLITQDNLRFLGSALNVRTLDLTVPVAGLNLADFVQVVFSNSAGADAFEVSVRDTYGNVRTASATADIAIGTNGAGLFVWASGALGGDINLGGRSEVAGTNPDGLTGFTGEIGLVNIYDRILAPAEIQLAFDGVATVVAPPVEIPFVITQFTGPTNNTLTLTWNSIEGHLYDAQFSTSLTLDNWFDLSQDVTATAAETTKTFNIPPNQPAFYLRIKDFGLD